MNNSSNLNFSIHEMNNETLSNHEESFLSKFNNHKQDSITASCVLRISSITSSRSTAANQFISTFASTCVAFH